MSRARLVRLLALVALASGLVAAWLVTRAHEAPPVSRATQATHFAFAWPKGQELTYSFTWTSESALAIAANDGSTRSDPMRGAIDLRADLVLRSYGARGDVTIVSVALAHPTHHGFTMLGGDVMPDDASASRMLEGHVGIAEITAGGVVRSVAFEKRDPEVFKVIAERVLGQAMPRLRDDGVLSEDGWQVDELGPAGRARVEYRAGIGEPFELTRRRLAYEELTALPATLRANATIALVAEGAASLDPRGWLRTMRDDERLEVRHAGATAPTLAESASFAITLTHEGAFEAPTTLELASDMDVRRPGVRGASPENDAHVLEQRIGGLTREEMLGDLASYGALGRMNSQNRWVSRASGLVVAHPELAAELVARFAARGSSMDGRALVMDVLASAGTPEAQAAMRDALATPKANADSREHAMLVQRFSFVRAPDDASLAFLARGVRAPDANTRGASLYALGAAVGNLTKAGKKGDAVRWHQELTTALRDARTPEARRVALGALGNAGQAEDAAEVARFATSDASADVRAAAVRALRDDDADDARAALVTAASDPSADVERAAFQAMATGDRDLAELARVVTSGRTLPATDADLVNALAAKAATSPDARGMLAYVLDRTDDLELAGRVRAILGGAVAAR